MGVLSHRVILCTAFKPSLRLHQVLKSRMTDALHRPSSLLLDSIYIFKVDVTALNLVLPVWGLAAYYRGANGIVLVYDVTSESSFSSETFALAPSMPRKPEFILMSYGGVLSRCKPCLMVGCVMRVVEMKDSHRWPGVIESVLTIRSTTVSLSTGIRSWIRNIEEHASDNVCKILVGNKCDMSDKRVSATLPACLPRFHLLITNLVPRRRQFPSNCDAENEHTHSGASCWYLWASPIMAGHHGSAGAATGQRVQHQVF